MKKSGGTLVLTGMPAVSRRYDQMLVIVAFFAAIVMTFIILFPIFADAEMGKGEVCVRGFVAGVIVSLFLVYAIIADLKVRAPFLRKAEAALEKGDFSDVKIKMWCTYTACTFTARQRGTQRYVKGKVSPLSPNEYEWELIG